MATYRVEHTYPDVDVSIAARFLQPTIVLLAS